jgi:hypothetical protein
MEVLSQRINSLPVSATLAMAAKARELKTKNRYHWTQSSEPDLTLLTL